MDAHGASPLVDRLVRLGLTTYEARAYVTLVRRDSFTAAQVSRQAGLPRQRIYDVLGSLVQRGLASARPGTVVKYAAMTPQLAIERLVAARRNELQALERDAAELIEFLTPQYQAGRSHTDPLEYIEVLRDRGAIAERFRDLRAHVEREILIFRRPPYDQPTSHRPPDRRRRAPVVRSIYELSALHDRGQEDQLRTLVAAGEEIRFVPELPHELVIADESIVMFGMRDPVAGAAEQTMVIVEHPALAATLRVAFLSAWEQGMTFDEVRTPRSRAPAVSHA